MTEYIVNVPDEEAEYFIARFGLEGTTLMGYHLTGEIVRCRDCVNCYFDISSWMCGEFGFGVGDEDNGEPDGFCAWGERKEVCE